MPAILINRFFLRCSRPVLWLAAAAWITACGDAEKEARVKWREEEVNAKEAALLKREQDFAAEKERVEALNAQLADRERQIAEKDRQLQSELEKQKRIRQQLEIKGLRGPIPSITAERAIIVDAAGNDVLWEHNADKKGPIASTQKLLTALLIVEKGELDSPVTIDLTDTQCPPVRIGLKPGEIYTRRALLTALLVKSSNDIAQALARDHSGSVEAFVAKMNERAAALGLKNSMFTNPHGLPSEPEQYSTARELAVIARAADLSPDLREMMKLKRFAFEMPAPKSGKKAVTLENTNRVLLSYNYCDGMKTGFTQAAGYCLVASGEKNGRRRIVVVLNDTAGGVWKDAQALLEWALRA